MEWDLLRGAEGWGGGCHVRRADRHDNIDTTLNPYTNCSTDVSNQNGYQGTHTLKCF